MKDKVLKALLVSWAVAVSVVAGVGLVAMLSACATAPPKAPLECPAGLSDKEGYCCVVNVEMSISDQTAQTGEFSVVKATASCIDRTGKRMDADLLNQGVITNLGMGP